MLSSTTVGCLSFHLVMPDLSTLSSSTKPRTKSQDIIRVVVLMSVMCGRTHCGWHGTSEIVLEHSRSRFLDVNNGAFSKPSHGCVSAAGEGSEDGIERTCDTLLMCIVTVLNQGLRNGGGVGDVLRRPSKDVRKWSLPQEAWASFLPPSASPFLPCLHCFSSLSPSLPLSFLHALGIEPVCH